MASEESIRQGVQEANAGQLADWDAVKADLGLKGHDDFLTEMANGIISQSTANAARKIWELLQRLPDVRIPVPAASAGPDGQVFYSWNSGRHHFEIEILPNGDVEFFYRDRETGRTGVEPPVQVSRGRETKDNSAAG